MRPILRPVFPGFDRRVDSVPLVGRGVLDAGKGRCGRMLSVAGLNWLQARREWETSVFQYADLQTAGWSTGRTVEDGRVR